MSYIVSEDKYVDDQNIFHTFSYNNLLSSGADLLMLKESKSMPLNTFLQPLKMLKILV